MENIYRNDSDPVENNIRRVVREWEEAPPSEWDTPPAALWDKIAAATPPPPATGMIWWKWLSGAVLMLGLAAGSLWWFSQTPTPEKQEPAAEQAPLMAEQPEQSGANLRPEPAQQPFPETSATAQAPSESQQNVPSANISGTATTRNTPSPAERSAVSDARRSLSKNDGVSQNNLNTTTAIPTQNETAVAELPLSATEQLPPAALPETHAPAETPVAAEITAAEAPVLALWSPTEPLEPLAPQRLDMPEWSVSPPEPSIRRAPKTGHFFAGIHIAPNRTFREIQSNRPGSQLPLFLRENESASWATEYGIRLGWQPHRRFALSIGAGSYSMSMQTRHRFRIAFDPGRERPTGNNNFESNYNLSIPSSYGDANVEVGVQRPGNQSLLSGQALIVNTRTFTELRYISMPMTATYFVHSSPRFSVGVKGGVAISLLEKQNFSATSSINLRGLRTRNITVQRQAPDINKTIADYHVGAALWYRPTPGWTLYLEPSYRHGIGATIKHEAYSVSQYAWGVQLGVQKSF